MSYLNATVSKIESSQNLHIVEFECSGQTLSMMSLGLNEKITIGTKVKLVVKPTHLALGKEFSGLLSYANQLKSTIISIEEGELLSSVNLNFFETILESVITKKSSQRMKLQIGDSVLAFIKASDLSISEILDV